MRNSIALVGELDARIVGGVKPSLAEAGYSLFEVKGQSSFTEFPAVVFISSSVAHLKEQLAKLHYPQQGSFLVVATNFSPELFLNATRLGAWDILTLTDAAKQLLPTLLSLLKLREEQSQTLPLVVAEGYKLSAVMEQFFRSAGVAAGHNLNLLITGETGTGKEHAARMVHRNSARADAAFVPINCTALPSDLLEAELFGHTAGAFTGATRSRAGQIEAAAGGTLLLDEIGDLPLDLQPKLLQFLEGKTFSRLGEAKRRLVDIRVIAATHQNLAKKVKEGSFRADLYFRLTQAQLHLPPIRERKEDIADLMKGFIKEFNSALNLQISGFTNQVLQQACAYSWPGNIRELRNILRLAAIEARNGPLLNLPLENRLYKETEEGLLM